MNEFYVYFHICKKTKNVFYIGKGKGERAYNTKQRTKEWKAYVEEHGYKVKIFKDQLKEDEAYLLEAKLIDEYKEHGYLVNIVGVLTSPFISQPKRNQGFRLSQQRSRRLKEIIKERVEKEEKIIEEIRLVKEAEENEKRRLEQIDRDKEKELIEKLENQRSINRIPSVVWNQSQGVPPISKPKESVSDNLKKQLNYLYSQGRVNPFHYYKQKSKW